VARKERNLYSHGVVHDDGVPHGHSDDPLIRAPVLLRPPGEALPHRGRCEPHDLSHRVAHKIRNTCFNEKNINLLNAIRNTKFT
jgi:hypothetical protein